MGANQTATFGEMLQRHRVAAGLTQEELAERARLSARGISDLERGVKTRPHLATIRQLAEALALSEEERDELQRAARGSNPPPPQDDPLRTGSGVHTFLIADVRGYTQFTLDHGDEAAARLATRFAQVVEDTVTAREGRLIELRGDEALVIFSSPRQALSAAVDLQSRLDDEGEAFPLGIGIGLDAGEAISVGDGYRGTALNLAARLCSRAEAGEVLASEGVIHLARKVDGLLYTEREMVSLKGFAEPVKVIAVSATQSSTQVSDQPEADHEQSLPVGGFLGSLPSGALVARGPEMTRLQEALESSAGGQGRLVLLSGEPGIGKTRLAQELTLAAHDRGFLIAAGRCYQPQQSVPYYPFLDALGMAYSGAPVSIRQQAAHRWPYLARLLPDQLTSTAAPSSDSAEEQERLFRAVSSFVLALAEHDPVALLLDDLHWADSASLHLLQHLSRQTRAGRVLIVATYRDVAVHPDHPLEATLRDLSREQVMERVTLKRLGENETSTLITETVGELEAVPEFAALVYRHTDGNPFFTQQVLQALVENGSLYQEGGRWQRRAIGEIEVPESVRSVIAQRVAHLSPEAQEVLQEASVLGPAFTFDDLLQMKSPSGGTPDIEDALDTALADAASFRLVLLTGKDRYEFDHALTQHALYATLTPRRRRRLHLAAGESMENLPQRARSQRAAEMAWHFLQGDNEEKAIRYSLLAGDQAESVFAHQEAEQHYRTALELAGETGDATREVEALEKLGVVLRTMGRYDEALELLETAARLQHQAGDLEGEGQVVAQIGVLCNLSGAAEYGISRVRPLVETLETRPPTRSLALLYAALVRLYNFIGSQADQLDTTERLLDLTRQLTDDRLLAEAEVHRGVSLMYLGRYEEALRLLESAIPRAESVGDLHTVCLALDFGSLIYHAWHQLKQARIYRDRSVEVAERLGDPREIAHRATEGAYLTFLIGDWDASREYAERAVTSAMEQDNLRTFVQPLYTLAELALYSGDREDAAGYLQESTTVAVHLGLTSHIREVQTLLAEQDLLDGNPQSALERFRSVLDSPGWEEHPTFLVSFAAACVEAGDLRGAQDAVIKAVGVATQQRLPVILVDAHRVQAAIAREHGAWDDAESHIELAISQSRDIAYPWGEARALYDDGVLRMRRGDNAGARESLRAAAGIFERLGARPYRMRADRLIEIASDGGLTPLQPPH